MKSSLKKYLWLTVLALLSFGVGTFTYKNPGLKSLEESALDFFFKLRLAPREDKIPDVALVMVDGKSFGSTYGYYDPLPRRYLSELIDSLAAHGANVIGLDIAFLEAQTVLDPAGDTLLCDAMRRSGNVVAVSAFETEESGTIKFTEPHPLFRDALKGVGYANLDISSSGVFAVVRSVKPFIKTQDNVLVPSFSTVVYCLSRGLDIRQYLASQTEGESIERIPLDDGTMRINFAGPPPVWKRGPDGSWTQEKEGRILAYRSSSITEGLLFNPDALKGKVVLVGNLSEFAVDQFLTPYYGAVSDYEPMRGVEVHANAFLTIAQGKYIRKLSEVLAFVVLAVLALIAVFITSRFHALRDMLIILLLLIAIWGIGYWGFAQYSLWLPAASMSLTIIFANASVTVYSALTERKERKRITGIFGQYVDERVVRQLIENPEMSKLGGAHREVTILFSDINDFTHMSEMLGPDKTVKLMNNYLTEMSDIIQRRGGTIDKFIGDSIMAFWGAPVPTEEAPFLAAAAALQMQKRLEEIRHRWKDAWGIDVHHRIGINSGVCTVGNIGSERKTNYTAMGDVVNLTSRIQDVNKRYGTVILMSEYAAYQVSNRFIVREIERVTVDGRKEPVTVFELRDAKGKSMASAMTSFLDFYTQGLASYKKRDWDEATAFFQHAMTFAPSDPVCQFFIEKIALLKVQSGDSPPLGA
jgi:class 3 adenylate cyclase